MGMQCAPEQEFRHRDKLPWRDAALKRRSSTTNKGPLLSSRHRPPARFRTLRIPLPECTSRNSSPACRPRGLRRSRKRGKEEFFSLGLAPGYSEMSIHLPDEKNSFRLLHL